MSKKLASQQFLGRSSAKPGFSSDSVIATADNRNLSRQVVQFCTYCVDKIVSKAAHSNPSL
jgi:hypothetical protein